MLTGEHRIVSPNLSDNNKSYMLNFKEVIKLNFLVRAFHDLLKF